MVFIVRETSEELSLPAASQKIVKAKDFWAFKKAEEIIADAERKHKEIVDEAKEAYKAEQRRGYLEGTERAKLEQSGNMMEIVGHTVAYLAKVENQMADLVLEAMRRIVSDFDDRERILTVVRNSLSLVRSQKHLVVRVHPNQVPTIRSQLDNLMEIYPNIAYIDIVGDANLAEDACVVESDIGVVEASLSGQIEAICETFKKVFGRND